MNRILPTLILVLDGAFCLTKVMRKMARTQFLFIFVFCMYPFVRPQNHFAGKILHLKVNESAWLKNSASCRSEMKKQRDETERNAFWVGGGVHREKKKICFCVPDAQIWTLNGTTLLNNWRVAFKSQDSICIAYL